MNRPVSLMDHGDGAFQVLSGHEKAPMEVDEEALVVLQKETEKEVPLNVRRYNICIYHVIYLYNQRKNRIRYIYTCISMCRCSSSSPHIQPCSA